VIRVPVLHRSGAYEVLVGPGARASLPEVLPPGVRRAAVVTQEAVPVEVDPGVPAERFVVPPGEAAKTLATVEQLCRGFARFGLSRSDVVVAVGGGVVTDLGGFAAACYHRGVAVVHVATTLLAQVDAAVGGKCGVNLPEGKNLVGAFWQPSAVLCDTDALRTLPPEEERSGLGEVAKYVLLGAFGARSPADPLVAARMAGPREEQVARCVAFKAAVVRDDEREEATPEPGRPGRAVLNYGHTLAHALEAVALETEGARVSHGEAVAVGLVFAARLARRLGRVGDDRVREHEEVVRRFGLPTAPPWFADPGRVLGFMARDKKARGELAFVLDGPAGMELVRGVREADVAATLAEMGRAEP
jgi:5-deoxy-5-amino-3-dehydroquinate synthase